VEVERKWLVSEPPADIVAADGELIDQGYLAIEPDGCEARLRRGGDRFFLTVKTAGDLVRDEYETELTEHQFAQMWPATEGRRIVKTRYAADGVELDVYGGELSGLTVVEVEFTDAEQALAYVPPSWFGREVTADRRYKNRSLAADGRPENERG
jgi:adenylate cyclase